MSVFEQNILRLPKPNYKYITKEDEARAALNEISKYNILEVDSETTGLDPYTSKASLLQIGIPNKAFVFDVRNDTEHSNISWDLFKPILTDKNVLKILQNAVFDMKVIKLQGGYYVENIYDTMLVEQLFYLGLHGHKADLATLVFKYLGITVDKEPRNTFADYNQTFQPFQLEYAANDVLVLDTIRNMQIPHIIKEGFENVCRLEFEFTKPMCEMELNGICFDVDKQRIILKDVEKERDKHGNIVRKMFAEAEDQTTLFGVSLINIDSNHQLKKALNKSGFELESTDVKVLKKYAGMPIIDELLAYRKAQKFISTYGESLIAKINPITQRLHTHFRQMVATGRMSSSEPNLQNIPKKQIYRSCFITKPGYVLVTCDMSGAELRIMGNLSADKLFVECYSIGQDLHTRTASEVFNIPIEKVLGKHRNSAKAINFGLCYGLSKYGLARGLSISEKEADNMIRKYFERYSGIKRMLDNAAKNAVRKRYSTTISGRKRFYNLPEYGHSDFKRIKRSIEREGKNAVIQGANADTIKEAMIYVVDRLEESGYDAKLLLTVHDEVVIEVREDQKYEVAKIVSQCLIDGFARYFSLIPMEADALIGECWLKSECENEISEDKKCGGKEMVFVEDKKYGTKIVCKKCGAEQ
jgi:DNA polymerase I-like protein with 3'-5' exonuclease and polymerase domains